MAYRFFAKAAALLISSFTFSIFLMPSALAADRPATVSDSIRMLTIAETARGVADHAIAPDNKAIAFVVKEGNLSKNANDYSLLFSTVSPDVAPPHTLVRVSSESNYAGISNVRWSDDGRELQFLALDGKGTPQIHRFDLRSKRLAQITHHSTAVLQFGVSRSLGTALFVAARPERELFDSEARKSGLLITNQYLPDLIRGKTTDQEAADLVLRTRSGQTVRIPLLPGETPNVKPIVVSLDGRRALVSTRIRTTSGSAVWNKYTQVAGQILLPLYRVVEMDSGSSRILFDAPAERRTYSWPAFWMADSKTAIVPFAFLPPPTGNVVGRDSDFTTVSTLAIHVDDGRIEKIGPSNRGARRIATGKDLLCFTGRATDSCTAANPAAKFLERAGADWIEVDPVDARARLSQSFEILVSEDVHTPPRLEIADMQSGNRAVILDLAPQLNEVSLGKIRELNWTVDGLGTVRGGLYLPPSFRDGQRYPLVIQTHGWDVRRFSIDGESSAGYAAQALANAGAIVAQLAGIPAAATVEGDVGMRMYEAVIDRLDAEGLIDSKRVGIQAWSRTGYSVRYALAFSRHQFKAAFFADASEAGYWSYISGANIDTPALDVLEQFNGGKPPFGDGLEVWIRRSPTFNLTNIRTPTRIFLFGSSLNGWETFAGLKRLGHAVELVWLPNSSHAPVLPSERIAVQQGAVDWFRYWLMGETDSSAAKAEQYKRWNEMRLRATPDQDPPDAARHH